MRSDICIWTLPVRWPRPLAGPGGQECAVVRGWDPPSSAPDCPPSPHTSRLFIMNCGKRAALAASSGSCRVYGVLLTCKHTHNTIATPPPSATDHSVSGLNGKKTTVCTNSLSASASDVLTWPQQLCCCPCHTLSHILFWFFIYFQFIFIFMTNTHTHLLFVPMDSDAVMDPFCTQAGIVRVWQCHNCFVLLCFYSLMIYVFI